MDIVLVFKILGVWLAAGLACALIWGRLAELKETDES